MGAAATETPWDLRVAEYRLTPSNWPADFDLRVAVLADIHAVEPWMSADRIRRIVAETNRLKPDLTLLAGDYEMELSHKGRRRSRAESPCPIVPRRCLD